MISERWRSLTLLQSVLVMLLLVAAGVSAATGFYFLAGLSAGYVMVQVVIVPWLGRRRSRR